MIDVNTFLLMVIYILGAILIGTLIVLVVKLISTVNRLNVIMDDISQKISKFDKAFKLVDVLTDNMAMVSDKLVDGITCVIRKVFYKKENRKEEKIENEQ